MVNVHHGDAVRALHLKQRLLNRRFEIPLVVALHQVGQDLRVGFRAKGVAGAAQTLLQHLVVLDNAVVDQEEPAGAVGVRVSVGLRRLAVSSPARVGNTHRAFGAFLPHALLEARADVHSLDLTRDPVIQRPDRRARKDR